MAAQLISTSPRPFILKHQAWPELIADLSTRNNFKYFGEMSGTVATAVLAAPVAIARWIASTNSKLAQSPRLNILVIGAETTDAVDQGRWYQVLPQLLDTNCTVNVTLVGNELNQNFDSSAAAYAPDVMAQCVCSELIEFIGHHKIADFDLAVVFHPGLQKHRHWLIDGSFAAFIAAGVPLMAASYGVDEYEVDRWVLECYGFDASTEPVINPLFLDLSDTHASVCWGKVLWCFSPHLPSAGFVADHERLLALDLLTSMVMHSMTKVGVHTPDYGAKVELRSSDGGSMTLIHIFDNHFMNPENGALLHLTDEGKIRDIGIAVQVDAATWPGMAARSIERAIWAARIKARCLVPLYPWQDDANAVATAQRMFDMLRAKAARLFKQ